MTRVLGGCTAELISSRTGRMQRRNWAGCSPIGKWSISVMTAKRAPGIFSAVSRVSSRVHGDALVFVAVGSQGIKLDGLAAMSFTAGAP